MTHALDLVRHSIDAMRDAVWAIMRAGDYRATILDLIEQAGPLPAGVGGIRTIPDDVGHGSLLIAVWSTGDGGVGVRAVDAEWACVVAARTDTADIAARYCLDAYPVREAGVERVLLVSDRPLLRHVRQAVGGFGPH
jgi:hypothetical protein